MPAAVGRMTAAHRTSGVAPLLVFFDTIDTGAEGLESPFRWKSGVVQPRDRDGAQYSWDFGDAASGAWATTGNSRNTATGYTAAHVYELPGTYTVTLSVTDETGVTRTYAEAITVSAFRGRTYYVAANGSDTNDGLDPRKPFATFDRGFAAVNGGTNRRLLLRRGDTFDSRGVKITRPGPGIIGAYGAGARPVLRVAGREGGILVAAEDWRVMDLDIVGPGLETDEAAAVGYTNHVQTRNALVLRVRSSRFRVGLGNGDWKPIYATPHDGNAWVDCEVDSAQVNGAYVGGRRLALMGNDIHDIVTSHVLRVWQAHKAVISNNRLWNPGPTRAALKLHGTTDGDGRPPTRWVTVSDNLIRGKTWSVAVAPQDTITDERPSHVVLERNRFFAEPSVQVDLFVNASDVLVRNNVFDATGASKYYTAIWITHRGVTPVGRNVRVLNNTVARTDTSAEFQAVTVDAGVTDVTVLNTLAVSGGAADAAVVDATGASRGSPPPGARFRQDHNLLTAARAFANAASRDYSVTAASGAVDAGITIPEVREDFLRRTRPQGANTDLGAYEASAPAADAHDESGAALRPRAR